ncbi:hypothetical protein LX36DRAFT_653045 [Colletotrichum falcatum]|nr:hypothetical protein LX36DRAFT_653045 [Colletotrichum falcatum]
MNGVCAGSSLFAVVFFFWVRDVDSRGKRGFAGDGRRRSSHAADIVFIDVEHQPKPAEPKPDEKGALSRGLRRGLVILPVPSPNGLCGSIFAFVPCGSADVQQQRRDPSSQALEPHWHSYKRRQGRDTRTHTHTSRSSGPIIQLLGVVVVLQGDRCRGLRQTRSSSLPDILPSPGATHQRHHGHADSGLVPPWAPVSCGLPLGAEPDARMSKGLSGRTRKHRGDEKPPPSHK